MPFVTVSSTCGAEAEKPGMDRGRLPRTYGSLIPPHLDLSRFDPQAELTEGSVQFVHVAEHDETLPRNVLPEQDLLYLLAQGRRIRHVLVVLRDLPAQDHMTAVVHLGMKWLAVVGF